MENTQPILLGVPKIIYETLEDIFEAQIRKLAADIGKTLHVDPKVLMIELKKEKVKTYLFEDATDVNLRCKSYEQYKNIYTPCSHPNVYGKGYCIHHLVKPNVPPTDAKIWSIVYHGTTKYYRDIDKIVYDLEGNPFGRWNSEKQEIKKIIVD